MSDIVRLLPPDEWRRLEPTEAGGIWRGLNPETTRVVVVERDGDIVACWIALQVIHAECLWVAPHVRHATGVTRRLLMGMHRVVRAWRGSSLWTQTDRDEIRRLITKAGGMPVPGTAYVVPVAMTSH